MAIKNVTFSFDIPITMLLSLIETGNAAMRVDVYGDNKPPKGVPAINGHAPKLLEAPKPKKARTRRSRTGPRNNVPNWHLIILALADAPDRTLSHNDMKPILVARGMSANSASPITTVMRQKGWVKRIGDGTFQLTQRGERQAAKLREAMTEKTDG